MMSIQKLTLLMFTFGVLSASGIRAQQPHVAFITGDDEYRSEYSMPMIAKIIEAKHGMRTSIAYAKPTPQSNKNIEGLEALESADLAVFYLRWRELPDDQLKLILDYVESGKPIVGLRTTTHSFRYPEGSPHENMNDGFGIDVMGQKWIRHHGHFSSTDVQKIPEQASHPVLRGVRTPFHVRSWLYVVDPLHGDSQPLLMGQAISPQNKIDYGPQPVAWTKTYKGARIFFTTLGHPEDFQLEAVRRLFINGIYWALGREVPASGSDAGIVGEYDPPASGTK
jgi:type 1 glutamine amidotransferase